jgi:Putative prokaryotic signal transducing protein
LSSERDTGAVLPLACPTCARKFALSERFCPDCETPLVYVGRRDEQPITAAHERAGKVDPRYTGGEPVKVAFAQNLAEAQLIQGMLLEEGIPSFERRSRGFDVPDFLAAGPRDILVPEAAYEAARELLADTGEHLVNGGPRPSAEERPLRLIVGLLIALVFAAGAVWALFEVAG